ncbi:MAG: DNA-binding protein [bacterium]
MFKIKIIFATSLFVLILSACGSSDERPVPEGYTRGIVVETMNSGGYTYMLLEQDNDEVWIAATEMEVKKDDTVYYSTAMEMKDFHSNTMNRDFKKIIFAENCTKNPWKEISKDKSMKGMGGGENPHETMSNEKVTGINVEPIKDGYTIEKLYSLKSNLSGKTVKVRGKVVKFNSDIMGKNWVHLQDGTGSKNDFDITITTDGIVNVGDVVGFEGVLALDKDFGAGYKFSVIIENASIIKEMSGI